MMYFCCFMAGAIIGVLMLSLCIVAKAADDRRKP